MSTDIRIRLGKKIKALRRSKGWRQIDLAAHAELSKTHICELETGKREIGLFALERIAEALEVKASEILRAIGK